MSLIPATKNAFKNLSRNKVRTALSLLGIVIGVFSVTIIISLGVAVKAAIIGYVESFASRDFVSINPAVPGASQENSMHALMLGAAPMSLTYDDLNAMKDRKNVPHAMAVAGIVSGQEFVRYGNEEYRTMLIGTSADYPTIVPMITVGTGRYFTDDEERSMSSYILLGSKAKDKLFGGAEAIGQKVKVKGVPMEVIGTLKPMGGMMGIDVDSMAVMPLRFMQKRLIGNDKLVEIDLRANDEASVAPMMDELTRLLRKRHRITDPTKDDFLIMSAKDITDRLNTITDVITWFLAFLAAISLVVGGIGIMNIMLVSVTERIREVGLRKALGAKNHDILLQFLAESVALTTAGGIIGGGIGFLLTLVVVLIMNLNGLNVPYLVSVEAFVGAAIVAAVTGIVFGLQPARKAAALDPITSLRYE
ncbi:MAG: ABC transporter permease [Patescibacteria group bacterium]|nr:ABC transporter permease [Patescibacteria group bacterium]